MAYMEDLDWRDDGPEEEYVLPEKTREDLVAEATEKYLIQMEAREAARRIKEGESFSPPPTFDNLTDEFDAPDSTPEWTIQDLHVRGTNTTITAGFKTGKTTLMLNLLRSLADSKLFLGMHTTRKIAGRIAFVNFEVPRDVWDHEARRVEIENTDKIWHVPARGFNLNIMTDPGFEWFKEQLIAREIEVLILDPFSGAYTGKENDNTEENLFFKRLDELKQQAGVPDLFMPAHTGRTQVEEGQERARGGTKIDDWADTRWILTRKKMNDDSEPRFISAEGRMVQLPEDKLDFNWSTNLVTRTGAGGRKNAVKSTDVKTTRKAILKYILDNPGCNQAAIIRDALGANYRAWSEVWPLLKKEDRAVVLKIGKENRYTVTDEGEKEALSV